MRSHAHSPVLPPRKPEAGPAEGFPGLIRKSGAGAFTLREVARMAGVSHNAPYRHFRDKEELLAALAAEGFDRLTER